MIHFVEFLWFTINLSRSCVYVFVDFRLRATNHDDFIAISWEENSTRVSRNVELDDHMRNSTTNVSKAHFKSDFESRDEHRWRDRNETTHITRNHWSNLLKQNQETFLQIIDSLREKWENSIFTLLYFLTTYSYLRFVELRYSQSSTLVRDDDDVEFLIQFFYIVRDEIIDVIWRRDYRNAREIRSIKSSHQNVENYAIIVVWNLTQRMNLNLLVYDQLSSIDFNELLKSILYLRYVVSLDQNRYSRANIDRFCRVFVIEMRIVLDVSNHQHYDVVEMIDVVMTRATFVSFFDVRERHCFACQKTWRLTRQKSHIRQSLTLQHRLDVSDDTNMKRALQVVFALVKSTQIESCSICSRFLDDITLVIDRSSLYLLANHFFHDSSSHVESKRSRSSTFDRDFQIFYRDVDLRCVKHVVYDWMIAIRHLDVNHFYVKWLKVDDQSMTRYNNSATSSTLEEIQTNEIAMILSIYKRRLAQKVIEWCVSTTLERKKSKSNRDKAIDRLHLFDVTLQAIECRSCIMKEKNAIKKFERSNWWWVKWWFSCTTSLSTRIETWEFQKIKSWDQSRKNRTKKSSWFVFI